jgi:tetratricopeptide (TPR) repeat protein
MILCQKCGAVNQIGEEGCYKCGTKLMIVSAAYQQNGSLPMWEEHFLERISVLEYTLGRLDERLNEIHDLVQQLASESFYDHTMIESIAEALKRVQIVGKRELEHDWHQRVTQRLLDSEEREKFELSKKSFLNAFTGTDRKHFARLIEESNQLFIQKNYRRGLRTLERAFSADPRNCEVGIFLGKIYYEFENFADAGKYLRQVLKSNPHHFEANLLTGLLAKRRGDLPKAKEFLSKAVNISHTSLAAHLFLGSVLVSMGEDSKALTFFSRALDLKPSPQMYLLVGSIYSRQGRIGYAIKHMKKAIEMDPYCDEAFFQLGLAFLGQNWRKKAKVCFETALHLKPKESRYRSALELFLKKSMKLSSKIGLKLNTNSNEESMETLVKDELRLNFRRFGMELRSRREGFRGK